MIGAGQILKERRLDKKLSLEDVAKATKIRISFLEAIEKGDYKDLPSSSYAQGFVRNYGQFLGFRESQIMPIFRREFDSDKSFTVLPKGFHKENDFPIKRARLTRTIYLIAGLFFIVIAYILFQYRYAFINPPLNIDSPKEGATLVAQEVEVAGNTDPNSTIYVNNTAVSVDINGNFKKTVDVFSGPITIKIRSVNHFGKETDIERHVTIKSE